MLIKIQRGEEDGDAQSVSMWLQRVLVLAVCAAEGLIYCWSIPLCVAFALPGSQLPNCRLLLPGKVQGAVGGKGGTPIFSSSTGWGRNVQRLTLLFVTPVSHGQQPQPALLSLPLLLFALNLKTNQHWTLGRQKKRAKGGKERHSSVF